MKSYAHDAACNVNHKPGPQPCPTPRADDYYHAANYYRERFNYEIALVDELERTYAKEKAEAQLGKLRHGQSPRDLVLIYKKSHRARDLCGDIAEAQRNAQTYALAVLVERSDVREGW